MTPLTKVRRFGLNIFIFEAKRSEIGSISHAQAKTKNQFFRFFSLHFASKFSLRFASPASIPLKIFVDLQITKLALKMYGILLFFLYSILVLTLFCMGHTRHCTLTVCEIEVSFEK
jgi:hypothetical protein